MVNKKHCRTIGCPGDSDGKENVGKFRLYLSNGLLGHIFLLAIILLKMN